MDLDAALEDLDSEQVIRRLGREISSATPVVAERVANYVSLSPAEVATVGVFLHKAEVSIGLDPKDADALVGELGVGSPEAKTLATHYVHVPSDVIAAHYDRIHSAALRAIDRRRFGPAAVKPGEKINTPDPGICPSCFLLLPQTGICDNC
jgi:hypothetical protein